MSNALERLFKPRAIAIVGASTREDAIGFRVIRNLRKLGFGGTIHPINPRYSEVAGLARILRPDTISRAAWQLLQNEERRRDMRAAGLTTVDGRAGERIAADLAAALAESRGPVRIAATH